MTADTRARARSRRPAFAALAALLASSWLTGAACQIPRGASPPASEPSPAAQREPAADVAVGGPLAPTAIASVTPPPLDEVLYNPGTGFADSHFASGYRLEDGGFASYGNDENPPPPPDPAEYPPSTVAYFRWCWSDLEPAEGQIDFARLDRTLERAATRSQGERLGFRIVTIDERDDCMPGWLLAKPGYRGQQRGGRHAPDFSNPVFTDALERLFRALGARFDGHPGLDHVDIGAMGCWGEWNSACLQTEDDLCAIAGLSARKCLVALRRIIDIHADAFPRTPKIMLGKDDGVLGDAMDHALARGAGWRVDCLGDWGIFGSDWSHHANVYPGVAARASDAWKRAPVHLEICTTFPAWLAAHRMSPALVQQTFDWALAQHASLINGKSTPVPAQYAPLVERFLKKLGYRLSLAELRHRAAVRPGEPLSLEARWRNAGVAPPYQAHAVSFRLRSADGEVPFQVSSLADIRSWLPGDHALREAPLLPADLAPGEYTIDVAILAPYGHRPSLALANGGRRPDGWYPVSRVRVQR